MKKFKRLAVIVDNPESWFIVHGKELAGVLKKFCREVVFYRDSRDFKAGDVLFVLSCTKILNAKALLFHKNNIVVHASDLPKGKGWSPAAWQVEAGCKKIPVTLFEASVKCDSGDYYIKDHIALDGTELIDNIRLKIARKTLEMIQRYLAAYPVKGIPQKGKETFYPQRQMRDNELNINKSIKEQFDKMRVADNERYPLFFHIRGKSYKLKIYE